MKTPVKLPIILILFVLSSCSTYIQSHETRPNKHNQFSDHYFPPSSKTDEIKNNLDQTTEITEPVLLLNDEDPDEPTAEATLPSEDSQQEDLLSLDMDGTSKNQLTANKPDGFSQKDLDQALDLCQASQEFWQKGDLENAIQALDQAYSLILAITPQDDTTTSQQKDDLRFMISKRILEIYASRNIAVNGKHQAIPIIINDHVQKEINRFLGVERKFFIRSLKRSGKYRPFILAELRKHGLPEALSWLPLIESGFKVNALSKARALGLWQFIPSTGYKFGLNRDRYVDERLDPYKATSAAITYLSELHEIFGDWSTVLAAYNCGEGKVLRIIRKQNVNYLDNFWDLYTKLPRETARYVPRFMATLHIIENAEKYGINLNDIEKPTPFETISIDKQVNLKDVANLIRVPRKTLKGLNPELRYNLLPGDPYPLRIPAEKGDFLRANLHTLKASALPKRTYAYHRVRRGETLSTIAKKYRINVNTLARANHIHKRNIIIAGNILKIPQKGMPITRHHKAIKRTSAVRYVVRKGDSLWRIAQAYGVTPLMIQRHNQLASIQLHIGQILQIPGNTPADNQRFVSASVYRVKRGDSPFKIAQKHNMDLQRLLALNHLTKRSKIYPGQKLYVE